MATYLVTGVAGFIASKVAELLLAEGHTVIGVDNLNNAYDVRLKQWRLDQIKDHPNFCFQRLDIIERHSLSDLFKRQANPFDGVLNLAARAGVRQSVENPWVFYDTNTIGTLNLLELCKEFSIPKFVLASTSSLYGNDNPMPWQEEQNTDHPLSPYAASKKAAEVLCHTYHYLHNIDVTIFRYFTVYGPAGRPDMSLFRFVQWISEGKPVTIYGDGKQSRDFTYVDDIARGTILGLKSLGYEIINLGSEQPILLMDAIHLIEDLIGKQANLQFIDRHSADIPASWAGVSKAYRLLGWQPNYQFHEGVKLLTCWYQNNHAWANELST